MRDRLHQPDMHTMSFGDHLEELRRRLFLALAIPLPLFIVMFFFSDTLVEWLIIPVHDVLRAHDLPPHLQVLSPPEFLLTKIKLSLISALVASGPWILYQAWHFVAPGLYEHERRFVHLLIPGSFVLTVAGVALLYWVMLPLMLHVLVMIGASVKLDPGGPDPAIQAILDAQPSVEIRTAPPPELSEGDAYLLLPDFEFYVAVPDEEGVLVARVVHRRVAGGIEQSFRVSSVIDFTLVLILGVTIAFQMPLVIMLLGWIGLASPQWLRARRRYALAICGVVAAVITPADAFSMIMMLIPLYALYELGIVLLVLAPASKVAEGKLLRLRWSRRESRPGKRGEPGKPGEPDEPGDSDEPGASDEPGGPDEPDKPAPQTGHPGELAQSGWPRPIGDERSQRPENDADGGEDG